MDNLDLKRLAKLDHEWQEIEGTYRLGPYNAPTNLAEEREAMMAAFAAERSYNPQFEYAEPPEFPTSRIRRFIQSLDPEHSELEESYYRLAHDELLKIEAVQTHAPDVITGHTSLIYGIPDNALIASARAVLKDMLAPKTGSQAEAKKVSAQAAAAEMQKMLDKLGLEGWTAQVFSPMSAKVSVNRIDNLIKIREGALFSPQDLRRLLVHEIGVHVLRAENGRKQPVGIFSQGFPRYLATEEGLAVYSEETAGVIAVDTMRKYAGRVIAAALALSHSFDEVFHAIVDDVGPDTAFEIVARAKRGVRDTAQPGAHTKDLVYLQGYLKVRAYLEAHPDDYEVLFVGKIGLSDVKRVKELMQAGMVKAQVLTPAAVISERT